MHKLRINYANYTPNYVNITKKLRKYYAQITQITHKLRKNYAQITQKLRKNYAKITHITHKLRKDNAYYA